MCTDEQWGPRPPTGTIMISDFWRWPSFTLKRFNRNEYSSFWLTPLDVPYGETEYKWNFPSRSSTGQTHTPSKLR